MRLHQPTGIWLLLWPCWWSIALATPKGQMPDSFFLVIFGLGAMLMRPAGCIVNDWLDRKFDAEVIRTRTRPLASGEITMLKAGLLMGVLLLLALLLLLQLNLPTQILGIFSLLPVAVYPLMKRLIPWPQAFLGLTFNWGALMGWTAVTGSFGWPMLFVYAAAFCWTMGYDTLYAVQDREDDRRLNLRSTALSFGDKVKIYVLGFYLLTAIFLGIAGYLAGEGRSFNISVGIALLCFIWQAVTVKLAQPADCMAKFKTNGWVGAVIFAGIVLR